MNSIASIALRQAFLKPFSPQVTQVANARIYASHSDGLFRMGKLKKRYMQKAPIVVTKDDGSVQVEGVSNKQYPEVGTYLILNIHKGLRGAFVNFRITLKRVFCLEVFPKTKIFMKMFRNGNK